MGHSIVNSIGIICKVCVALFVFLSGYGLSISNPVYKKLNPRSFYIRRFTKLFMNYWLIWLLFVPASILVFDMTFPKVYGEENTLLYSVFDFFGILNITGRYGYNPTWWFYSCIITLYVLFPIISTSIRKWPFSIWIILVLSVCIIKVPIVYINPIRYYLFPFIIGILFSNQLIFNKLPPSICNLLINTCNGTLKTAGNLILILMLFTAFVTRFIIPYALLWDTVITILIVLLYKNIRINHAVHGTMVFLGKHSFNIFLFHTFIYYLFFTDLVYWSRNPVIIFLTLIIISLIISQCIDSIKSYIGFNKLVNKINLKIA